MTELATSQLLEPFQLPFMQRALVEVLIIAVSGSLIGVWISLRKLAFFTHGAGAAAFPGAAAATALGISPLLAISTTVFLFALLVTWTLSRTKSNQDLATGLALVTVLAIGVAISSSSGVESLEIDTALFGSLLTTSYTDILLSTVALLVIVTTVTAKRHTLTLSTFQPDERRSDQKWLLAITVAALVTASIGVMGTLLVGSLIATPAASAQLYAKRLPQMYGLAASVALPQSVIGLWVAYQIDVNPGPVIALCGGVLFAGLKLLFTVRFRANKECLS